MAENGEKPIWERLPGEPRHQYEAFRLYRDLGPMRTVSDAVRIYLGSRAEGTPLPAKARERQQRSQAAFRVHPQQDRFIHGMAACWGKRWATRWDWPGRCDALDAYNEIQAAIRHDADRRAAEDEAERKLAESRVRQLNTILGGGEIAIARAARLMDLVNQGGVRNAPYESQKRVSIVMSPGGIERTETKVIGMDEAFPATVALMEKLQVMELVHRGMPGRTIKIVQDTRKLRAVIEMIRHVVEPEKWDEVLVRLAAIDQLPDEDPES